eukprot:bmy_04769T0
MEHLLCSREGRTRADTLPALTVVTSSGEGPGEGQSSVSGFPEEVERWSQRGSRAVPSAGSLAAPPLCPGPLCQVCRVRRDVEQNRPLDGQEQRAQRLRSPQGRPGGAVGKEMPGR